MKIEINADGPARFWKADDGGATFTVCAPDSTSAMLFILRDVRLTGSYDEMQELHVEELLGDELLGCHVRDEDGNRTHVTTLITGDVCCSEWP